MYGQDDHRQMPDRGRGRDPRNDYDDQREDSYRRHDYSRSPGEGHRSRSWRRTGNGRHEDGYGDHNSHRRGHGRSDDRRRDFDAGNYSEMYDEPREAGRHRQDHHDDRGRDRGRSRSPSRHRRRSRSRSPARDAGQPNDTVILEGLPFSVTANELRDSLLHHSIAMEFPAIDVRIQASRGQRRAFVQFDHLDNAVAFVTEHYPKLIVVLQDPTDEAPDGKFEAYLHYARRREEWDSKGQAAGNWTCPLCNYSNYSTRTKCKICDGPQVAPDWQQSLTGAADASNTPSQILVIYPLASFVDEDMLAADMKRLEREKPDPAKTNTEGAPKLKSTAPGGDTSSQGAREGSLHRVFLMRDASTNESFKYGFAEFWTLEDAAAALAKFIMARAFNVAGCAVTIATIHMGVFLPDDREMDEYVERESFHPLFNPTLRVRYRDPHVYPSQRQVTNEPPGDVQRRIQEEESEAKKAKKRKAEGTIGSSVVKKTAAPMGGQMALWQKKHDELHDGAASTDDPNQIPIGSRPSPPKSDPNAPIKISLAGSTIGARALPDEQTSKRSGSPAKAGSEESAAVSYVDRDRLMCLICMRKYKSVDEVNIHERSRNHKTATENEELVKAALPRLAVRDKRKGKQASDSATDEQQSQYRDRAKERRQAYNQPTKPKDQPSSASKGASKPDPKPSKPEEPKPSKGAGMLAKMGWTTGSGLGADGAGRTEAIATNAYQEGAGLGAEGANLGDAAALAEKKTTGGYKEYLESVQDRARERYNKME